MSATAGSTGNEGLLASGSAQLPLLPERTGSRATATVGLKGSAEEEAVQKLTTQRAL